MDRQRDAELELIASMGEDDIDTSDIPEVADWSGAEVGKFYRPIKKQITLRIDEDVLEWFRGHGPGYQSAINSALRGHVARQIRKMRVRSGEPCPDSGIWAAVGAGTRTVAVAKGEPMPHSGKKAVVWFLVRRAA